MIQYTTYERLVGALLAWRIAKGGITPTGKRAGLGRSSLSDWDLFFLGAASKLVATGGTYPYVSTCSLGLYLRSPSRLSSYHYGTSLIKADRRQVPAGQSHSPHLPGRARSLTRDSKPQRTNTNHHSRLSCTSSKPRVYLVSLTHCP